MAGKYLHRLFVESGFDFNEESYSRVRAERREEYVDAAFTIVELLYVPAPQSRRWKLAEWTVETADGEQLIYGATLTGLAAYLRSRSGGAS